MRGSAPQHGETAAAAAEPGGGLDAATLRLSLDAVGAFLRQELPAERQLELDQHEKFPAALVRRMLGGSLRLQLLYLPQACGGLGGGAFDLYRVAATLAGVDLGVATAVLAGVLTADLVASAGTPGQRRLWLTRLAEEGLLSAFCATEAEAGSDLAALAATAEPVAVGSRRGGYRLSGSKQWISNGGAADLYAVLARAPGGASWFLVEAGTPGLAPGVAESKHGIRASNTAAVHLDGVVVGSDRLLGGVEGRGLAQAASVFGRTRLVPAAFGVGAGWAALERAIAYSATCLRAGEPLGAKRGYTHKLVVPHAARLEAGRALVEETAESLDAGAGPLPVEAALAKYLAGEAANRAAGAALQALGAYGYSRSGLVEKIRRDAGVLPLYEGTAEILEGIVARGRWKLHLATDGCHYREEAVRLEELHARCPAAGAGIAALAADALAGVLTHARQQRLTRHGHFLLRLGELIAWAEAAASLARRAARAAEGGLHPKADGRLAVPALAAASRVFAREAAATVAGDGARWVLGAAGAAGSGEAEALEQALRLTAVHRAQAGLLADMDALADALYGQS